MKSKRSKILIGALLLVALVVLFFINFKPALFFKVAINMQALNQSASVGEDIVKHPAYIPVHWINGGWAHTGGTIPIWGFILWFIISIIAGVVVNSKQMFVNNKGWYTFLTCTAAGLLLLIVNFVPRHYEIYGDHDYDRVAMKYCQLQEKAVDYLATKGEWQEAFRRYGNISQEKRSLKLFQEVAYQAFQQNRNLINTLACRDTLKHYPEFSQWYLDYRLPYLLFQHSSLFYQDSRWTKIHQEARDDLRALPLEGKALKVLKFLRKDYHLTNLAYGLVSTREALDDGLVDQEVYCLLKSNIDRYLQDLSAMPKRYSIPKNRLPTTEAAIKISLVEILATAAKASGAESVEEVIERARTFEKDYWGWRMQLGETKPSFCWALDTEMFGYKDWVRFRPNPMYERARQAYVEARLWPGVHLTEFDEVALDLARMTWEEFLEDAKSRGIELPQEQEG